MSTSTRKKEPAIVITREEMEQSMAEYRQARIDQQAVTAELNAALTLAREPYDVQLSELNATIDNAFARIKAWAVANPAEFKKPRSITLPSGTLGYKLGNFTVEPIEKRTLKSIVAFLVTRRGWMKKYCLRVTVALNKEFLLARRVKLERKPKLLEKIGIRFVQEDSFYVDAKIETALPVSTEPVLQEAA
jgi:phage host-nuclease inhibitor protein Gam